MYSVSQSCLNFYNPMECNLPSSSVHGILHARILEWVAISFSRGSFWPRNWTRVSCIGRWILYRWASGEAALWAAVLWLSVHIERDENDDKMMQQWEWRCRVSSGWTRIRRSKAGPICAGWGGKEEALHVWGAWAQLSWEQQAPQKTQWSQGSRSEAWRK